jgi:hypothetical protein
MATINVKEVNLHTFHVTVSGGSTTEHEVNVDPSYAQQLSKGKISTAELVKKSFEFLLERESNNSILRRFDLSVISRYFPEYEHAISKL